MRTIEISIIGDAKASVNTTEKKRKYQEDLCRQFVMLPMAVLVDMQDGFLTAQDVCFYTYLLAKQGNNEKLWWGIEELATLTGICESGVKKCLRQLVARDHIKRIKKMGGNSDTICLTRVKGKDILIRGQIFSPEQDTDSLPHAA